MLADLGEMIEIALENLEDLLITKSDKLEAGFGKAHKLIRKKHRGFVLDGKRALTVKRSQENVMCVSPSGGGKSTTIIFPSILCCPHSMIVNDNSGELSQSENYLLSKGFVVKYLDFGNPEKSLFYNPLKRICSSSDIAKVSSMLVRTSNEKSDFWTLKSEELISICIEYLTENESQIYRNLANVYYLLEHLQSEPETIRTLFKENATETLQRKLEGILKNSENTRASIISSALASLNFIGNDKELQNLTCVDTIDFDSFRRQKTALFIRCPLGNTAYYQKIISIFFEQFFSSVFNKALPSDEDLPISIIADELGSMYLPNLASIISNARKFLIPILGVLQSENQIFENYGSFNAKTILNNAGVKVYFTGLTDESENLSKILGEYEYEDEKGMTRTRRLMTADEIRTMPKNQVLIIPSGGKPLKVKTTPYYKQRWMVEALNMKAETNLGHENPKPSFTYTAVYLDLSTFKKKYNPKQEEKIINVKFPKYGE
jgi:type IV secretory pathway TraG/TraD family ATPase VirD4